MTEQEKRLLLVDLCARVPYGVIVQYKQKTFNPCGEYTIDTEIKIDDMLHHRLNLLNFKPYLRPISSMTEDEKDECTNEYYKDWAKGSYSSKEGSVYESGCNTVAFFCHIDWLNKHMFDYRGLITMGLAIEAPEGMYNENS